MSRTLKDHAAHVDDLRAKQRAVRDEIADTSRRWRPLEEAIDLADRRVDALAATVDLDAIRCVAPREERGILCDQGAARLIRRANPASKLDVEELISGALCRLFPTAVKQAQRDLLAENYRDVDAGLPAAARATQLVALQRELDDLERDEERAIEAAEAAGVLIERRADVRAAIVLGPDVHAPAAMGKLAQLEERARQRHAVVADLEERRVEARARATRARRALDDAHRSAREMRVPVGPTFAAEVEAAEAELARLEAECARAVAAWSEAAGCLPVLRNAVKAATQAA